MALDFRPFLNTVQESVKAYTRERQAYNDNAVRQKTNNDGKDGESESKSGGGGVAGNGNTQLVQASIRFNNAVHACDAQNLEDTLDAHGIYFDQSFNTKRNEPDVDHSISVNCTPKFNVLRKGQDALHTLIMRCSDECNDVIQHLTFA